MSWAHFRTILKMKLQIQSRSGYHVIVWSDTFDPSLATLITSFPELVLGHRIAIASCDSGPFQPDQAEMAQGWTVQGALVISPCVQSISDLPTPGFDEWYVYDGDTCPEHHASFVNHYSFSPLDEHSEFAKDFWKQVERFQPLHALGAGPSMMFFLTRDETVYKKLQTTSIISGAL